MLSPCPSALRRPRKVEIAPLIGQRRVRNAIVEDDAAAEVFGPVHTKGIMHARTVGRRARRSHEPHNLRDSLAVGSYCKRLRVLRGVMRRGIIALITYFSTTSRGTLP